MTRAGQLFTKFHELGGFFAVMRDTDSGRPCDILPCYTDADAMLFATKHAEEFYRSAETMFFLALAVAGCGHN